MSEVESETHFKRGSMDIQQHESMFSGFMTFLKVGTGVTFGLVLVLVIVFANPF